MHAGVDIVATPVALVRKIGLIVVFEAIDPAVVVHVDAEEKLRTIGVVAQEGFLVVRHQIRPVVGVVLIEIGDEVVVLVVAGKDGIVDKGLAKTVPVRATILIVVVVDEFVDVQSVVLVVDLVLHTGTGEKRPGRVVAVHAVPLEREEPGIRRAREVDHPGPRIVHGGAVILAVDIRILPIAPVEVVLTVEIEPKDLRALEGEAEENIRSRQPVRHP